MRLEWTALSGDMNSSPLVNHVATHLRAADRRELETTSRGTGLKVTPAEKVVLSARLSRYVYAGQPKGPSPVPWGLPPIVLWGVADSQVALGRGVAWMVATPHIKRYAKSLIRDMREWIAWLQPRYPDGFDGIIDSRNRVHVRWLEKLGFRFAVDPAAVFEGVPFFYFRYSYAIQVAGPDSLVGRIS